MGERKTVYLKAFHLAGTQHGYIPLIEWAKAENLNDNAWHRRGTLFQFKKELFNCLRTPKINTFPIVFNTIEVHNLINTFCDDLDLLPVAFIKDRKTLLTGEQVKEWLQKSIRKSISIDALSKHFYLRIDGLNKEGVIVVNFEVTNEESVDTAIRLIDNQIGSSRILLGHKNYDSKPPLFIKKTVVDNNGY